MRDFTSRVKQRNFFYCSDTKRCSAQVRALFQFPLVFFCIHHRKSHKKRLQTLIDSWHVIDTSKLLAIHWKSNWMTDGTRVKNVLEFYFTRSLNIMTLLLHARENYWRIFFCGAHWDAATKGIFEERKKCARFHLCNSLLYSIVIDWRFHHRFMINYQLDAN